MYFMTNACTPEFMLAYCACVLTFFCRCEGAADKPRSWSLVCENQCQLRNMEGPEGLTNNMRQLHSSFHYLASTEKPVRERDSLLEEEPSIENNMEVCDADQYASGSVQLNVIEAKFKHQKVLEAEFKHQKVLEAKFKHQKVLEGVLKVAPAQQLFEGKLSETWKQEYTAYDDLIPSLSPYCSRSQNFANGGFVKVILQPSRKKLNMVLDISAMAPPKPNSDADSLEIQGSLVDNNYSPAEGDVVVVSLKPEHKGQAQAIGEKQQKGE